MAANPYSLDDAQADEALADTPDGARAERARAASRRAGGSQPGQIVRANAVLAVMFVVGAGLVYGLSLRKGPAPAAAADQKALETQVDGALLRLAGAAGNSEGKPGGISRQVLETFYDQIGRHQVPLEKLGKNPFAYVPPAEPEPVATPGKDAERAPAPDPLRQTREQAMARLNALHLQAIQRGKDRAVAIISNNLVTEGQKIECFTVRRIVPKAVILTWQGQEYTLRMP